MRHPFRAWDANPRLCLICGKRRLNWKHWKTWPRKEHNDRRGI